MALKYSFQEFDKETMVRVSGRYLPVSVKTCTQIGKFIKGRPLDKAINLLERIAKKEFVLPMTVYHHNIGHRRGVGIGGYPVKASLEVVNLLKQAQHLAKEKGFENPKIIHFVVLKGPTSYRYGRKGSRRRKVAHIEIVVQEEKKK